MLFSRRKSLDEAADTGAMAIPIFAKDALHKERLPYFREQNQELGSLILAIVDGGGNPNTSKKVFELGQIADDFIEGRLDHQILAKRELEGSAK